VNAEPDVNVWVRSLPLTVMRSDEDEDVTDPSLCWGEEQLKLPADRLVVVVGGLVGGVVPPPVLPPPDEEDVELEVDVPSDDWPPPLKHPVIISAAALAASVAIRVFIDSSAFRNNL
jgi:hypothetical protein